MGAHGGKLTFLFYLSQKSRNPWKKFCYIHYSKYFLRRNDVERRASRNKENNKEKEAHLDAKRKGYLVSLISTYFIYKVGNNFCFGRSRFSFFVYLYSFFSPFILEWIYIHDLLTRTKYLYSSKK